MVVNLLAISPPELVRTFHRETMMLDWLNSSVAFKKKTASDLMSTQIHLNKQQHSILTWTMKYALLQLRGSLFLWLMKYFLYKVGRISSVIYSKEPGWTGHCSCDFFGYQKSLPVIRNISKETAVDTLPKSDMFAENRPSRKKNNGFPSIKVQWRKCEFQEGVFCLSSSFK